jgi:hypothetical protein
MPASFTSNSKKEQKMLAYVRDFQRVFQELYPHRYVQIYTDAAGAWWHSNVVQQLC